MLASTNDTGIGAAHTGGDFIPYFEVHVYLYTINNHLKNHTVHVTGK